MKKLFTNDKFFLTTVLMSVIGTIAFTIYCLSNYPEYSYIAVIMVFNAMSTIALYISYKRHSKNVMKGLVGFILMGLLALTITCVFPLEPEQKLYTVLSLANLVVVIALCVNHFVINADHHSRSANVCLNQVLLFGTFVLFVAIAGAWIIGATGFFAVLYMIGIPVGSFGVTAAIVCVESRLDAYRIDREAAGWTEETGYPAGYVHECEKK